ncbi:beta-lactamase family protein [Gordonia sp. HY285]|uniref:serine hydrolase domain-containing protein n=1 Tax=Gordonia liuliyuniae TaxID=2911517 RepID=UPI001F25E12C|nr:serine hydrolase domain-containing protein [Gordonia liuliyuniae]MCF8611349.1 beta-lactamase family protein [Gordonia liuliyuniae]
MKALAQLESWPVDHAAGAVVTTSGVADMFGDTARVFELASVTKLLVAQAVLVAVEEGAVDLATPAGPNGARVEHLLSHASGLAFDSDDVQAAPGEQRIYSSRGYELLADLVATETQIAAAEYLHEAVCEPLGMTSTALVGPAGHGARSNVDDLARFAADLLAPTLVSPQTAATARSVHFPGIDGFVPGYGRFRPNDWGLGPEIKGAKDKHWTAPSHSPSTFGHFGQSGTFLWVDPARGASCVVLTDRAFGPWAKPLWRDFNHGILDALDS